MKILISADEGERLSKAGYCIEPVGPVTDGDDLKISIPIKITTPSGKEVVFVEADWRDASQEKF